MNNNTSNIKNRFLKMVQEKIDAIQKNKEKLEEIMSQKFEDEDVYLSESYEKEEKEEIENDKETT